MPRSRSYWLSKTLSYRDQLCVHDPLGRADSLEDLPACNGMVDTAVGLFFTPFSHLYQDVNWIVIERPITEVKASLARLGWPTWGTDALASSLKNVKERAKLVVPYSQIDSKAKEIWQACEIPYEFDQAYWDKMKLQNLQFTQLPDKVPVLFSELTRWVD